jgi:5-methylcytosine-specific restriction endonuclease McrBC regulatory subunit McrC
MDNLINRTIRTVYSKLKIKGVSTIVGEFEAYDKFLESMGVMANLNDVQEIGNVRYTRLTEPYKPVMELSKTILSNLRAESESQNGKMSEVSYFIDIAELWEMYLLKLLQNNLPSEYVVYSPNVNSNAHLLEGKMREIRPDIMIERDGRIVMIIDAKYKNYNQFGRTSQYGIQREDLYQMTTYLYHYGNENQPIMGIFTSPVACAGNDIHTFSENRNHRIGLVNLNIESAEDDVEKLHESEAEYISKLINLLRTIC